jgi:hypothetical protein
MKHLIIVLILIGSLIAEESGSHMFAEENASASMIGDNGLNQDKIDTGLTYTANMEDNETDNFEKITDEFGNIKYYYPDTNETLNYLKTKKVSDQYKSEYNKLIDSNNNPNLTDNNTSDPAVLEKIRLERKAETKKLGITGEQNRKLYIEKENMVSKGNSFLQTKMLKGDDNTTQFYRENFSYEHKNNKAIYGSNKNKLLSGLKQAKQLQKDMLSKNYGAPIKCYITRQLIPSYICPIPGASTLTYGGDSDTSADLAKKTCENNCSKSLSCKGIQVIDNKIQKVPNSKIVIFPTLSKEKMDITINDGMNLKSINFKIKVKYSDYFKTTTFENLKKTNQDFFNDFNTTDINSSNKALVSAVFNELYLKYANISIKYSIANVSSQSSIPTKVIDKSIIKLESSQLNRINNLNLTTDKLRLLLYKTYSENDFSKNIKSIEIEEIGLEYENENIYVCTQLQSITNENECDDNNTIDLTDDNHIVTKICLDAKHKLGPDIKYGGFYSKESCNATCIRKTDCVTSYRDYSNGSIEKKNIYNVEVGCLEGDDNSDCTKEKCKEYVMNDNRPLNEWVVYNDDTKKQTISSTIIDPNIPRPKVSLSSVGKDISAKDKRDITFQNEMKDSAYKYMINKGTFNRIKYRIGEESPQDNLYKITKHNNMIAINWYMKGKSFDIDSDKDMYIYSVIKVSQGYVPLVNIFQDADGMINFGDIKSKPYMDITYQIKTENTYKTGLKNWTTDWIVFRKEENVASKLVVETLNCNDNKYYPLKPVGSYKKEELPDKCSIIKHKIWQRNDQYKKERNVRYSIDGKTSLLYSITEKAPYFKKIKLSSDKIYNNFLISNFIMKDLDVVPGGTIRNQIATDKNTSFEKKYDQDFDKENRGVIEEYVVYGFYSKDKLSYKDIIDNYIKDENIIYDNLNPNKYAKIKTSDGELKNNINTYITGSPDKTTVDLEITPYIQENGQKVFKFMFLENDENYNEETVSKLINKQEE